MNFRNLKTFIQVVRKSSFFKAAESLGYSQATVSQQIQNLERDLQATLFVRNGRRVSVSPAGLALYEQAVELIERADILESNIRDFGAGEGGVLRIGANEQAATRRIAPLLAKFCKTRPHLKVVFDVSGARALALMVANGSLDLALSSCPPDSLRLSYEPLYDLELSVLLSSTHPLARRQSLTLDDLCKYPLLLTEPTCSYRQLFEDAIRPHACELSPTIQISSTAAVLAAIESGFGIGVLPREMATSSRSLIAKKLTGMRIALTVGLIRRAEGVLSPVAAQFLEALYQDLKVGNKTRPIAV